jgi:hypothetical protein
LQQYFSCIVVLSFIGGGNRSTRKKPITCHKSQTNFEPSAGFKLTTLIVIATDCIGNYKTNYHTVMTTTAPRISERNISGTDHQHYVIKFISHMSCDRSVVYQSHVMWQVGGLSVTCHVTGRWLSTGFLVFSINKTDHHDITEKLLRVVLNTILHPLLASENLNKTK